MTAQPVGHGDSHDPERIHPRQEDPYDPLTILRTLPEREREVFLEQYREVAQAAVDDLAGYRRLTWFLRAWSVRAKVVSRPGHYAQHDAELDAIRSGTAVTTPIEEALAESMGVPLEDARAYWAEKAAAAKAARRKA